MLRAINLNISNCRKICHLVSIVTYGFITDSRKLLICNDEIVHSDAY